MTKQDTYSWKPLAWGCGLAGIAGITGGFADFVPCCRIESSDQINSVISGLADFSIIPFFISAVYGIVCLLAMIFAIFRLCWRKALSSGIAILAIPLTIWGVSSCGYFDPYYWHILSNETHLLEEARTVSNGRSPIFAKVEWRDVSHGLVINGNTFSVIVYDESDELGYDPSNRSEEWTKQHGHFIDIENNIPEILGIRRLHGHFYVVLFSI